MKTLLFITAVLFGATSFAQEYNISFTGSGASTTVSTVIVENLTKNVSVIIEGNDVLYLSSPTVIDPHSYASSAIKVYPNPASGSTTLEIMPPVAGNAEIKLFDITGRPVAGIRDFLDLTTNSYIVSGLSAGLYVINVKGKDYHLSERLISNGSDGTASIGKISTGMISANEEPSKRGLPGSADDRFIEYSAGDTLKFTGISGIYSTVVVDIPKESHVLNFVFVPCTDGDNNNYPVVQIGEYTWMAENLKTTRYKDGTPIPNPTINVDTPDSWMSSADGYCWYNNDPHNRNLYGGLYKLYSLKSGNLCPVGWHAPNNAEWGYLTSFLGGLSEAGGGLKETGEEHWTKPNAGATNVSGFTALPGGSRDRGGVFMGLGLSTTFWSISNCDGPGGCGWTITYINKDISWVDWEAEGFSVRCIYGEDPMIPEVETHFTIHDITATEARAEGILLKDHGMPITEKGVCWSTTLMPTINDPHSSDNSPHSFTGIMTGLTPATKYYVRAYAKNSVGTGYGMSIPFTTKMVDVEGNFYLVIQIGDQLWLAENLRTTKYSDNTTIPHVTDQTSWSNSPTPAYCITPGRFPYGGYPEEGVLYNWYCVNTGKLCPAGWHVPSDTELTELSEYLIANGYNYDGSTTGNKIGIALSAYATFESSSVAGAVGNMDWPYASGKKSGFEGVAAGLRDNTGFSQAWMGGYWWTSSAQSPGTGILYYLRFDQIGLYREDFNKNYGLNVRCLKGEINNP